MLSTSLNKARFVSRVCGKLGYPRFWGKTTFTNDSHIFHSFTERAWVNEDVVYESTKFPNHFLAQHACVCEEPYHECFKPQVSEMSFRSKYIGQFSKAKLGWLCWWGYRAVRDGQLSEACLTNPCGCDLPGGDCRACWRSPNSGPASAGRCSNY